MGMMQEFKDFAMKGNVVDLAVGVVIGAAFGKVVSAVVDGILMPIIGKLTGGTDFSGFAPGGLGVGTVFGAIINFTIVAFFLFMVIKAMNAMKKKEAAAAPPAPPASEKLLMEIRDLLKK
jgi:large conductance mechanosensitive channel